MNSDKCLGCGGCEVTIERHYQHLTAHFCNTKCQTAFHMEMWMPLERGRGGTGSRSSSSSSSRSSSRSRSHSSSRSGSPFRRFTGGGGRSGSSSSRSRSGSPLRRLVGGGRRHRSPMPPFVRHRGEYYTRAGYRGGRDFWRRGLFGFGYGLWWAWRYPELVAFLPYDAWYPAGEWVPYYYVEPTYVLAYTENGVPIPPQAYVLNSAEFGGVQLPALPSFAALGISPQALSAGGGAEAERARDAISAELANLRTQYAAEEAQGFRVVPDLDRGQFSWVKVVSV